MDHRPRTRQRDRKSTRLNSSHSQISYAVFCLKKKKRGLRRRKYRYTNSRFAPAKDTSGRRDIGLVTTTMGTTTVFRERVYWHRSRAICGRRAIGAGAAADSFFTKDIGARESDSMAGASKEWEGFAH